MNIYQIKKATQNIIRLLQDYAGSGEYRREMLLDPVIYGYFEAAFGRMSRQHHVRLHSRPRPQRIDFRHGGSNPVVFEFAVRPPGGGGHLYGSQNTSELRKLTRVLTSQARLRVLLLVDLLQHPISRENLKRTYDAVNAGRGRFQRHSVRVIYVHASEEYDFLWRPQA